MKRRRRILYMAVLWGVLAVVLSSGCGYSLHRQSDMPFKKIQIGTIENMTLEPKLQDKLYAALAEEFEKNGIRVVPSADRKLSAVIRTFDMTVLSEKQGITIEYLVRIQADFVVEDKGGGRKILPNMESPYIVSLASSEDLSRLLAKRELVEVQALRDMAMRLVGALIFQ